MAEVSHTSRFGLVGHPLGHSFSPQIHETLGSVPYDLFDLSRDELAVFFKQRAFDGVNVTIPYKVDALVACDELTPEARTIGAVNTVVKTSDGLLQGYNTDYHGFLFILRKLGINISGKTVLVLGNGGAARPIRAALADAGATNIVTVVRDVAQALEKDSFREDEVATFEQAIHIPATLVVNATPVGMIPHAPQNVLDISELAENGLQGVIDIIYNPARTGIIMQAERLGVPAINGLGMLVAQAAFASAYFLKSKVVLDERIEEIIKDISYQTLNIVLIGMPGSGKTTLAKRLGEKLGRAVVDLDAEIERFVGKNIPEIFEHEGERAFRAYELEVFQQASVQSGVIISCGGGIVETPEAYDIAHQNGVIVRIIRSLDKLSQNGRPLSQKHGVQELATRREPFYRMWADVEIDNNSSIEAATERLISSAKPLLQGAGAPLLPKE
ncbi:MAG: AAA family ATPase [Eggerthellaceae bacterium]|nr:AAA family ATPase [Eggerthellaceae bacterium]